MKAINDVLVVGDDCEGLLAAITLRVRLPKLRVQVLRHPSKNDFRLDGFAAAPAFLDLRDVRGSAIGFSVGYRRQGTGHSGLPIPCSLYPVTSITSCSA